MKNPRHLRLHRRPLRNPILRMGLVLLSLSLAALLLWSEAVNVIDSLRFGKESAEPAVNPAAMQAPWTVWEVSDPADDLPPVKENGEVRRVYPYSVVRGGVHSVQELRSAIRRDPVVARHYSDFKLDKARLIEARADRDFHVSYRMGKEIFWTKKKLKVAKNEKLITDGATFTRTRCANVLSEVLPGKTSPNEPGPEVFKTPAPPPSHATGFSPPAAVGGGPPAATDPAPFDPTGVIGEGPPPGAPSSGFIPPVQITGGSLGPGGGNSYEPGLPPGPAPTPVPAPVPEPGSLFLFVSGLLFLAGYSKRKFFKKRD